MEIPKVETKGSGCIIHQKHTHKGVLLAFETKAKGKGCSRQGEGEECVRHQKRALVGVFVVFETREGQERAGHHKHAHKACLWCLRRGEGGNAPDTTNTPTRRVCG